MTSDALVGINNTCGREQSGASAGVYSPGVMSAGDSRCVAEFSYDAVGERKRSFFFSRDLILPFWPEIEFTTVGWLVKTEAKAKSLVVEGKSTDIPGK